MKECYCYTCKRYFHPLGIMRHVAMHRDKKENCTVRYTKGDVYDYDFNRKEGE